MSERTTVPPQAWLVTAAGMTVNLCLGILYAWSVWKAALIANDSNPPGTPMTGLNAGWEYLSDSQASLAYAICGFLFASCMLLGGKIQQHLGPRLTATLGGILLGTGCIVAGIMQSYTGLLLGFGLLGGIGIGIGYSASPPAAILWFNAQRRGMIVGLVVGGYGAAAIYISPLAEYLIDEHGLTTSFIGLGCSFMVVSVIAAQFLAVPPPGYNPPRADSRVIAKLNMTNISWTMGQMLATWQAYGLLFLLIGSSQAGLLLIGNAAPIWRQATGQEPSLAHYAWILASFCGFINAAGRVGSGIYSDVIGRHRAYAVNSLLGVICLLALPSVIASGNMVLVFIAVGVTVWQFGGSISLMPAWTADYYGAKNLATNYGVVFLGFGVAFFMTQLAGYIKDATGSLDLAFYISAGILGSALMLSFVLRRPA